MAVSGYVPPTVNTCQSDAVVGKVKSRLDWILVLAIWFFLWCARFEVTWQVWPVSSTCVGLMFCYFCLFNGHVDSLMLVLAVENKKSFHRWKWLLFWIFWCAVRDCPILCITSVSLMRCMWLGFLIWFDILSKVSDMKLKSWDCDLGFRLWDCSLHCHINLIFCTWDLTVHLPSTSVMPTCLASLVELCHWQSHGGLKWFISGSVTVTSFLLSSSYWARPNSCGTDWRHDSGICLWPWMTLNETFSQVVVQ